MIKTTKAQRRILQAAFNGNLYGYAMPTENSLLMISMSIKFNGSPNAKISARLMRNVISNGWVQFEIAPTGEMKEVKMHLADAGRTALGKS